MNTHCTKFCLDGSRDTVDVYRDENIYIMGVTHDGNTLTIAADFPFKNSHAHTIKNAN